MEKCGEKTANFTQDFLIFLNVLQLVLGLLVLLTEHRDGEVWREDRYLYSGFPNFSECVTARSGTTCFAHRTS